MAVGRLSVVGGWFIVASALLILAAGCGRKADTTAEAGGMGSATKAADTPAVAVTVAPATTGTIDKTVDVTGSLVALQDVVVGNRAAGRVAAVYLHEGDPVSAGQLVAAMDTADLIAQVQQQQANLQAAITKEQQARATLSQALDSVSQAGITVQNAQTTVDWTDKTTATAVQVAQSNLDTAIEHQSVVKEGARTQERQQAQEAVTSAKAAFDKARADLRRNQDLFREQAVSQSQLDQAQATFDAAQASYNSAQQALSLTLEGARPQDIRQAELAVQQARDSLAKARADRDQVNMRREDVNTAKANLASARSGVASARAGIASAMAGEEQAKAALKVSQETLSYAYIKSPINGYVAERRAEPGQQLGGGGSVLRIVNPATVYFQAILSESDFAQVHFGQDVKVTVDALPETVRRPLSGHITRVLPVASSGARNFTVRIDLPGDRRMRPQMFARGSILIDTHHDATLVPKDSVLFDPTNNRTRVFIAGADGKAEERQIQAGYMNPRYVEILGKAVAPGDKVIIAGQNALQNGDPIKVQE